MQEQQKQPSSDLAEYFSRKTFLFLLLPFFSAWLALFCWPGFSCLASIFGLSPIGYLGSFGLVAIILLLGQAFKG